MEKMEESSVRRGSEAARSSPSGQITATRVSETVEHAVQSSRNNPCPERDATTTSTTVNGQSTETTVPVGISSVPLFSGIAAGGGSSDPGESSTTTSDGALPGNPNHQQVPNTTTTTGTTNRQVHTIRLGGGGGGGQNRTVRLNIGGGNYLTLNQPSSPSAGNSSRVATTRIPPQVRIGRHPRMQVATTASPGGVPTAAATATPLSPSSQPIAAPTTTGSAPSTPLLIGGGVVSNGGTVSHSPLNLRVIQLNPLLPQQLPFTGESPAHEEDESIHHFKCAICYEFMKDPVSCGNNCSSRFCYSCLHRVASGVDNHNNRNNNPNNNNNDNNNSLRCPTCRMNFSATGIVHDKELAEKIFGAPTVPCRYPHCTERLKLPLVSDHEKQCLHVPLKCRYSAYGCTWTGKRGDLSHHERNTCNLAKVSVLVEQLRDLRANFESRLAMVQQQAVGAIRMNNIHHQNLHRDQIQSTSNIFELCQYCHVIMCLTPHFLSSKKEHFSAYHRSKDGRAAVLNFMTLLPTFVISLAVSVSGFRRFVAALDNETFFSQQTSEIVSAIEDIALTLCSALPALLMLVSNVADGKTSVSWSRFRVPRLGRQVLMRDAMAISAFAIHLASFEYNGSGIKSVILWFIVALSTTFFPSYLLAMAHVANNIPLPVKPNQLYELARAVGPILVGLRHGLITSLFPFPHCLDASFAVVLLQPVLLKWSDELTQPELFLSECPKFLLHGYAGARMSYSFFRLKAGLVSAHHTQLEILDSVLALLLLLVVNFFLNKLYALGIVLGTKSAQEAKSDVIVGSLTPRRDYNGYGMVGFGLWICLLTGTVLTSS